MAIPELNPFLLAVTEANPCGDNLEYDPQFLQLEQAIEGKPEVQYGNTVVQATAPDWKGVEALAIELLARSRDLRVVVYLTRALLIRHGFAGFAAGVALLEGLLEHYWHEVHPQLDSQDNNDPTARLNTLTFFSHADVLRDVREASLLMSKTQGALKLRDLEYALGELPMPQGITPWPLTSIEAQVQQMSEAISAIDAVLKSMTHIGEIWTERVGVAQSIDFSPLLKILTCASEFYKKRLGSPLSGQATVTFSENDESSPLNVVENPYGEIKNQQQVISAIDRICIYYENREPSSPVGLLLRRAQRLVGKDFLEILQDLAPDGLKQAKQMSGTD